LRIARQTLVILIITFALTEITFRVYNHFHPSFVFPDTSYNRFRGKPNSADYDFHLNSKGFKDVAFAREKEAGVYRIVALGDSFAYGVVPYQNNYLTLLEERLNLSARKTEILNMGIVSTGPSDYLALLTAEGLELQPDMVLVSFFIGNDFKRDRKPRSLCSYSYACSFIRYLLVSRSYEGKIIHEPSVYDDNAPSMKDDNFTEIEMRTSEIYRKRNPNFDGDLEVAMKSLSGIKQICDERKIALVIVLIPDQVQVDQALQARVLKLKEVNSKLEDFDFELPNRLLAAKLKQQDIAFIDLLTEFGRVGRQTSLYKPRDTHWNIAGNRLAAEAIAGELVRVSR
jgi:hypothetical protein